MSIPSSKNIHFVGREGLLGRIEELLDDTRYSHRVALVGLGGIGKSQIAIEYAYRLRARTPGTSIFWLRAGNITSFETDYAYIATKLRLPGCDDPKVNQSQLVFEWLASESSGPWLLIVDNIDDERLVKPYSANDQTPQNDFCLLKWLPQRNGTAILTTSRNRYAASCVVSHADCILKVGNMQSKEAIDLLDKKLTAGKGSAAKSLLAKELEYIPLAMTQATAYIAGHERMTIEKYLNDLLGNQHGRLTLLMIEEDHIGRPTEIPKSMLMTWEISFNQILEKCPPAIRLLSQMSMYDSQHIPQTLLAAGADKKSFDLEGALDILLRYSFIAQEVDGKHFNMHLLVQDATKVWLRRHSKLELEREAAVRKLAEAYPSGEYKNWHSCQTLEPHVQAALNLEQLSSHAKAARAKLLFNRGWYFWLRGDYEEAEHTAWESLADRLDCLSPDDPDLFSSFALLALVLRYRGRYSEAEHMGRQALAGRENYLVPDHPDTLTSLENLALVLQDQNKFEEAEQNCRKALAGRERRFGFDNPETLTSCNILALVLQSMNELTEADQMYRRALTGRERQLGPKHPDTLTSYNNLGVLLRHLEKFDEAEQMCRRALTGRERQLGSGHPDTLTSYNNLGVLLRHLEKFDEAEQMCRRALTGRECRLGPDHPDTLTSLNNLAMVLHDQGKYVEGESISRKATERREEMLGPWHFSTLTSLSYLARMLRSQGKYSEAEEHYRRVLTGIELLKFKPDHPVRKKAVENLSLVLRDKKNAEAGELNHLPPIEGGIEEPDCEYRGQNDTVEVSNRGRVEQ
ncbi:hypothetical protein KCU73_g1786, partial [Aureobasidium melanogenum]